MVVYGITAPSNVMSVGMKAFYKCNRIRIIEIQEEKVMKPIDHFIFDWYSSEVLIMIPANSITY